MRIVSGKNKGMRLYAPKDMSVRPTSDKIKEAIFSMIGYIDDEAKVLDIFAGTGGMGIEFLARGAAKCVFVDNSGKSLSFVKKNIELCRFKDKAEIINTDYAKAVKSFGERKEKFDYIFADPPYHLLCCKEIVKLVTECGILAEGGMLIIESDKSEKVFESTDTGMLKYKEKIYGRTRVSIAYN